MNHLTDRWIMNRIGFVNFWLYDQEEFFFENGRLLLRGQNASGKSITTQSFIPFILDGNRSPERLDPFGSKDRKMDYYLLGDGEREDSTGYLYLELKKPDSGRYLTLGIGLRAQKGKSMNFWGFCITDGRRIGKDLELSRPVGTKRMPLSRLEMKNALGDGGEFVETSREYMAMVNRQVFQFERLEDYEQFIRLLIKVRAPKLSRDTNPSKVYSILNDSLQMLSDEDLRAMVETRERLDVMETQLKDLKNAQADLRIIRNEYDRYNRYMLGRKAQNFHEAHWRAQRLGEDRTRLERSILQGKEELKELNQQLEELGTREVEAGQRKAALDGADLEQTVERKARAEAELEERQRRLTEREQRYEEQMELLREALGEREEARKARVETEERLEKKMRSLSQLNLEVGFELHDYYLDQIREGTFHEENSRALRGDLKDYGERVRRGRTVLAKAAEAERVLEQEKDRTAERRMDWGLATQERESAQRLENETRDRLIEAYFIRNQENRELVFEPEQLTVLQRILSGIRDRVGDKELVDVCTERYRLLERRLVKQNVLKNELKNQAREERKACEEELEEVKQASEITPPRREKVVRARQALKEKGIPFLTFYEAVDFAEELSEGEKDLLEAQIEDMGLLDSLLIPERCRREVEGLLGDFGDCFCSADNGPAAEPITSLKVDCEDPELAAAAHAVLNGISRTDWSGANAVLADGRYRMGVLWGYGVADRPAGLIGAAAREARRAERISELETKLIQLREAEEGLIEECRVLQERIKLLYQEFEGLPQTADLLQAVELLDQAEKKEGELSRRLEEQEKAEAQAAERLRQCGQEVSQVCAGLPFPKTERGYEDGLELISQYESGWGDQQTLYHQRQNDLIQLMGKEQQVERYQEGVDQASGDSSILKREVRKLEAEIAAYQEFLDRPENREIASQLAELSRLLSELNEQKVAGSHRVGLLEGELVRSESDLEKVNRQLIGAIEEAELMQKYFQEEWDLGFLERMGASSLEIVPLSVREKSVVEQAASARNLIRGQDEKRSASEITTALVRNFQEHNSSLTAFAARLSPLFQDWSDPSDEAAGAVMGAAMGSAAEAVESEAAETAEAVESGERQGLSGERLRVRQVINLIWEGKELSLYDFLQQLGEKISDNEAIIREEDRKLFEDILSNTISKKLYGRIRDCKAWVADMDGLMGTLDTSMNLRFNLDWKGKKREDQDDLDTAELVKILGRDRELLSQADVDKVSSYFRNRIRARKEQAEENQELSGYGDLIREALDYRGWFQFTLSYYRGEGNRKELTNSEFNKFSGGEKAMAMYVPLFAAVSAQYKKAAPDAPLLIALDEAFAGVDEKNISSMFGLVEELGFCYIMNSQSLWGCYETVPQLAIADMNRPQNSQVVTVMHYRWNGKVRTEDGN